MKAWNRLLYLMKKFVIMLLSTIIGSFGHGICSRAITKKEQQLLQPHKRRILFSQVARVLQSQEYTVTWEICDRKWRRLQTMYKKSLSTENASGSRAINWEY